MITKIWSNALLVNEKQTNLTTMRPNVAGGCIDYKSKECAGLDCFGLAD